jgi:hypothetical protein
VLTMFAQLSPMAGDRVSRVVAAAVTFSAGKRSGRYRKSQYFEDETTWARR